MPEEKEKEPAEVAVKKGRSYPPEAMDALFASGPAVFSNKIFLTLTPMGVRLTFAEIRNENPGSTPAYRSAVFLPYPEALALRDLIVRQLEKINLEFGAEAEEEATTLGEGADG